MVGLVTDIGLKRQLNEDSALYFEDDDLRIYVVADGMGGHNAGEVASVMAVNEVIRYVKENFTANCNEDLLIESINLANKHVYDFAKTNKNLSGMGTTITACFMTKEFIQIANVGDSSCFGIKFNEEIIDKITKDHSLVQELVDIGSITEEEARNHPKKNIITRALGTDSKVDVDIFPIRKGIYDVLLLCSDGLTNEISKSEMLHILISDNDLETKAKLLVERAKMNGGKDNITVLLFGGEM